MVAVAAGHHPSLYLLTDHLDAALAAGEDLLATHAVLASSGEAQTPATMVRHNKELRQFIDKARTLELTLTARLLQGRKRAEEIKRRESHLKPLIGLFVSGTQPLVDAIEEMGNRESELFQTGDAAIAFLRTRGLVLPDAAGLDGQSSIATTDDYLVVGRIRLGTLLDLVATFLDMLDALYDIYGSAGRDEPAPASPGSSRRSKPIVEPAGAST